MMAKINKSHLIGLIRLFTAAASLGLASTTALARDVPISISWTGAEPDTIAVQNEGGVIELQQNVENGPFQEAIPIKSGAVEVKTLLVTYGTETFQFYLKINSFLPKVSFRLTLSPANSCTLRRVEENGKTTNMAEALKAVLQLEQLLRIQDENGCNRLTNQVKRARYDRMVELSQHSNGLFQLSANFQNDYLASLSFSKLERAKIKSETYTRQIASLEAKQLVEQRTKAVETRDFATAVEINSVMIERVRSDEDIAKAYRDEGVIERALEKDQDYLEALAGDDMFEQ